MAGSNAHGRLVAPNTRIPSLLLPTPYICTKNSVFTLRDASLSFPSRVPHMESISSMNMMDGLRSLAIANSYFMSRSLSPTNLEIKSLDETEKKVPSASVAHALARCVLPVPGGYITYRYLLSTP